VNLASVLVSFIVTLTGLKSELMLVVIGRKITVLKCEHILVVICRKIMMVKGNRFWLGLVEK